VGGLLGSSSHVFAVFDGHGTDKVSTFLEKNALNYLQRFFTITGAVPTEAEIHQNVSRTFKALHDDVSKEDHNDSIGGSTACLVILDDDRIVCSNAGDSRAILVQSDGVRLSVVPLSDDHKPDREDERRRIQDHGGCVVFNCSEYRVAGVLAMSRAIGDGWMAKYGVSCVPDTTVQQRSSKDEFVIVASDGIWTALSNDEAAFIVNRAMSKLQERGIGRKRSFSVVAKCLVKAAINRGSVDNISCIIIDVKQPTHVTLSPAVPAENAQVQQALTQPTTITTSRGFVSSSPNIDPILSSLRPIVTTKGSGPGSYQATLTRTRSSDSRHPYEAPRVSLITRLPVTASLPVFFTPLHTAISDSLPMNLVA
jgi:serine/threonine protein phosphatase PrpC